MSRVLQGFRRRVLVVLLAAPVGTAAAQVVVAGGGFTPGGQTLFATDFTQDAVGDFPQGLKLVRGSLDVVERDGVRMLRSTSPSEFLLTFPAPLPAQFTLEFDIVARAIDCCAGEELAVEGSPTLARTPGSAQLLWHHQYLGILGGGKDLSNSTVKLSETLQAELLGQLGHVQIAFDGPKLTLYTNGVRLYNLPDVAFRRSNVLRVYLGGLDDGERAVYLARIRVAVSGGTGVTVAGQPTPGALQPGTTTGTTAPGSTQTGTGTGSTGTTTGSTGTQPGTAPASLQITVTPGQTGPVAQWTAIAGATYVVRRWKKDDPACCSANYAAVTNTTWADSPLQAAGTYVYEVTATAPVGTFLTGSSRTGTTAVAAVEFVTEGTGAAGPSGQPVPIQVTVALGTGGPVVQWTAVQGAATYTVDRTGENQCCSLTRQGLTDPIWYDGMLPQTGTYLYAVTAFSATKMVMAKGYTRVAADSAWVAARATPVLIQETPMGTGSARPMSLCAPLQPTAGFQGPSGVSLVGKSKSPAGADLAWPRVLGAVGYAVERGEATSSSRNVIATSCETPGDFFTDSITGGTTTVKFLDRTGGIIGGRTYTYVIFAYSSTGSRGWNSLQWTAPVAPTPAFSATIQGSTVQLKWNCFPAPDIAPAKDFLITASYGYSAVKSGGPGCGAATVLGVPVGAHEFRITARWPPDVTSSSGRTITVSP